MMDTLTIPVFEPTEGDDAEDKARCLFLADLYAVILVSIIKDDEDTLDNAIHALEVESDKGDKMAKFYLGFAFFNNFEDVEYKESGIELMIEAMKEGADGFYIEMIDCIRLGQYVEQNEKKAAHLYRILADRGNADALFRLAYCYECGIGVKKNSEKAEKLYKQASEAGSLEALGKITSDDVGQLHGGKVQKWRFRLRNAPMYVEI